VYAVSSTTTSNREIGKNFGDGNKIRSGILKLYVIFGLEPCDDFIVNPWKEALLWWLRVEYELQNDKCVQFINFN
jgi:hypothetical protein